MTEALVISQVILWIVVAALAVVTLALARQIGILHERVAPMGALMTDRGPQPGDTAPVLEVRDLAGAPVRIGGPVANGKNTLVLFVAPTCPVCKRLLPFVAAFARDERRQLDVVLVGDGDRVEQERLIRQHQLQGLTYVISAEVGMMYRVGKLPYAVLLDETGVIRAKGLVNSREHLESLVIARETGYASVQDYLRATAHAAGRGDGQVATDGSQGPRGRVRQ
jgi:methylamine dehydrogenase accessory protein MauD